MSLGKLNDRLASRCLTENLLTFNWRRGICRVGLAASVGVGRRPFSGTPGANRESAVRGGGAAITKFHNVSRRDEAVEALAIVSEGCACEDKFRFTVAQQEVDDS